MNIAISKVLFALFLAVYALPAVAQELPPLPKAEAKTEMPQLTNEERLNIQLLVAQRLLAQSNYRELKAEFDQKSLQLDAEYKKIGEKLQKDVEALYKAYGLDPKNVQFDMSKGEFKPKPEGVVTAGGK